MWLTHAVDLAARLGAVLGAGGIEELVGGHQSRVFRVTDPNGDLVVAKVVDAASADRRVLEARVDAVAVLADSDGRVCRPLPINGQRITELTSAGGLAHFVVCYDFATGREPDSASTVDATLMGATLSALHESMSKLPAYPLPLVAALRARPTDESVRGGAHQLLHGDFNAHNLRCADGAMRIFDLDDCGYGPPEFDVANALYVVLFDAVTQGRSDVYETFRPAFVDGYVDAPGPMLEQASLDQFIDSRVRALGTWLDDLDNAPIGIRMSSSAWQATLRSFVDGYQSSTH